jgi:hypothetical protein
MPTSVHSAIADATVSAPANRPHVGTDHAALGADHARPELQELETKNTWLINETVEAPLQSLKSREMVFQLCKPLFDSPELLVTSF